LTGGPGTGKTTLLRALVEVLKAKKVRLALAAPTGRAAQRMSEATGCPAKTIHRTLKFDPSIGRFVFNVNNLLPVDFLVVDEVSMIDVHLMSSLLEALAPSTHVLLVGDIFQLPSVGPGNVLNDFIESGVWKVCCLSDIFRQGERSKIVSVAHDILNGQAQLETSSPDDALDDDDLHFIHVDDPEKCLEQIDRLCWDFCPKRYHVDPLKDIQILVPMHKGTVGIERINERFQQRLGTRRRSLTVGQQTFYRGDKVIQLKNNYEKNIFNGDLGFVHEVHPEELQLSIDFGGEIVVLERLEILDLKPAYAVSIHKSQGSEFPIVVIPLLKQHFVLLKRNLIYTAVTRGRRKVFVVGDPKAYAIAVHTQDSTVRLTTLSKRLCTA
jgi:exodeoxyribonuclease V alpha subunit